MMHALPPLTALRAFEAAARHESFTRAAAELRVTHGAVSRQVAGLEAHLGVRLFERRHRQVRLTPVGAELRDDLTPAFQRIAEAARRVGRSRRGARELRLSAPPAFSVRWLMPRLAAFHARHPGTRVTLTTSFAPPDFASDEYDVAVRLLARAPSDLHAVALFDEFSVPVCRADLLAGGPGPLSLEGLLHASPLIRVATEPRGWDKWARVRGLDLAGARFLDVEWTYLAAQAVLDGLGTALLPRAIAADDLERGVLAMPLGPEPVDASRYFVLSAEPPAPGSPAARLIDWLDACARPRGTQKEGPGAGAGSGQQAGGRRAAPPETP